MIFNRMGEERPCRRILRFQIDASYDGRKVVHFLRGEAGLSARLVQSLKRLPDGICLNGAPTRTIDQLCEGDELTLRLPDRFKPRRAA